MYCVTVLYPNEPGGHFDFAYYRDSHIPMMLDLLGDNVLSTEVRRGIQAVDGSSAPYLCLLNTHIRSAEQFAQVMTEHREKVLGDIVNYTNLQPIIQIDEML
ncbi:MAG TPA: EthD family reductase [Pseudomonas sp.]|jgi:uncharacterized protein (TIGR02118 family)|uniref:EthD family reductase n=1 Tax=Pseudomonas sp. TaxID=306 RepID=UPI00261B70DA|nr:EthD family reductase [Pseudomonas sp.]HSX86527.1 EthD family reductase [Pseudomonas sp.]